MTHTTISTEANIPAPIDRVWSTLLDFGSYDWNPYLFHIDGSATPGSSIVVYARSAISAKPLVQNVEVISVDPYTMRWEGGLPDRDIFKGDHWFVLDSLGSATTRLKQFEHFSGSQANIIMSRYADVILANFNQFNAALVDKFRVDPNKYPVGK